MPTSPAVLTLPRGERLRRAAEFQAVFQHGSRLECPSFVALWRRTAARRVGFAVSRHVRGAVDRNRVRRRVREAYRHVRANMPRDIEMVVVARPAAAERPLPELIDDMRKLAGALARAAEQTTGRT